MRHGLAQVLRFQWFTKGLCQNDKKSVKPFLFGFWLKQKNIYKNIPFWYVLIFGFWPLVFGLFGFLSFWFIWFFGLFGLFGLLVFWLLAFGFTPCGFFIAHFWFRVNAYQDKNKRPLFWPCVLLFGRCLLLACFDPVFLLLFCLFSWFDFGLILACF